MKEFKKTILPLIIFFFVFFVYLLNLPSDFNKDLQNGRYRRMMVSADTIPNTFLPFLMIREKTLNFKPIINTVRLLDGNKQRPYFLINTSKGYFSAYPIITGVFATPIYLAPLLLNKIPELTYHENILKIFYLGRVAAAFYASVSVLLFYLILNKLSPSLKRHDIVIFSIFYALGTSTWSVSSRGLWQHTLSQVVISAVVLLLLANLKDRREFLLLGVLVGLAVLIRPTNAILAIFVLIYIALNHKKSLLWFIFGGTPFAVFFLMYNFIFFGSPFIEGYAARNAASVWTGNLLESIPAYFISPARGYLFISPPLLLGFVGFAKYLRKKGKDAAKFKIMILLFLTFMLVFGKWYTWHGANAFGNRMLVDVLPILGLFAFMEYTKLSKKTKYAVVLLMIYSISIHANAVFFRKARCSEDQNWTFYCLMLPKERATY